jgi:hypothetical protein
VFLVGLSLGVPRRSVSYVDRFLVVAGLWWCLRRWCCLVSCCGCWSAHAWLSTGPTTYPALRFLNLIVACNSRANCSCFRLSHPRVALVVCMCTILLCKLDSTSYICFAG